MDLGRIGIWTSALYLQPTPRPREAAAEIAALEYGAIWIPEALGREAFTNAAVLPAGTKRIVVATGIANIWARDAMAMAAAQKTLAEPGPRCRSARAADATVAPVGRAADVTKDHGERTGYDPDDDDDDYGYGDTDDVDDDDDPDDDDDFDD